MKKDFYDILSALLFCSLIISSCKKKVDVPDPTVSTENFEITIDENPRGGQHLGFVKASAQNHTEMAYGLDRTTTSSTTNGHLLVDYLWIDNVTGELSISNPRIFDYEEQSEFIGYGNVQAHNSVGVTVSSKFIITLKLNDIIKESPYPFDETQLRLDDGETPYEIYKDNPDLLDSLYGRYYEGGLIFYLNTKTGKGMVSANEDQSLSMAWAPITSNNLITNATNDSIGYGKANTEKILATLGHSVNYAAKVCNDYSVDGYNDWYLPSLDELDMMFENLHSKGKGGFTHAEYWSSSEYTKESAMIRGFEIPLTLISVNKSKQEKHVVRAIRSF